MYRREDIKTFDIKTKEDVREFSRYVIEELKCNYHPDDSFSDMVNLETREDTFDEEAARYMDEVNERCFEVAGDAYYEIDLETFDSYIKELDRAAKA